MAISGGIHWMAPSVCMPPEDLISIAIGTNGHQIFPNLKIV